MIVQVYGGTPVGEGNILASVLRLDILVLEKTNFRDTFVMTCDD